MRRHAASIVTNIVIAITTTVSHHGTFVPAIRNTWGSNFAHLHVYSEKDDPGQGIVQVAHDPSKVRASAEELAALRHLADTHPDAPWYYKADDDAYLHAARLDRLAAAYDAAQPWYIGQTLWYDRGDGTNQHYCAGGVGYLISNALMKLLYPRLLDPIESCCSDVHVGKLVQEVLNRTDVDTICHTPATDSYVFHAAGTVLHPSLATAVDIEDALPGFVYDDGVASTLRSAVGFHYVGYVEQYVLHALYHQVDKTSVHSEQRTRRQKPARMDARVDTHASIVMEALPRTRPSSAPRTHGSPGSLADPSFNSSGTCGLDGFKCVVSFGLYGDNPRYTTGAVRNAAAIGAVFPGWVARFYYDSASVPPATLNELRALGAELVAHQLAGTMFARFLVAADSSVDRFIVRDADSRLGLRDKAAVDEWSASGYSMHYLRDHPAHGRAINGGMWGGVKGAVADMEQLVAAAGVWGAAAPGYGDDQDFLSAVVYPRTVDDQIAHDSISCTSFPNSVPFPTQRIGADHVGMVFDASEAPRMADVAVFFSEWTNDSRCRRQQAWVKG